MPQRLAATLLALLAFASVARAQNGAWVSQGDGPVLVGPGSGVACDGTVFYITDSQLNFNKFNPATGELTPLAKTPIQITYNRLFLVSGSIYSFGSIMYPPMPGGPARPNDPIFKYSIASNTWTLLEANVEPHGKYLTVVQVGSKLYLAGGFRNTLGAGRSDAFSEFNPATDAIVAKKPMPAKLQHHASAAFPSAGKVYIFGGNVDPPEGMTTLQTAATYEYTIATDTWLQKADITVDGGPSARARPTAFLSEGRIFLVGGHRYAPEAGINEILAQCLEYRPASNDWVRRADLGRARAATAAGNFGAFVHIYGGLDGISGSNIGYSRERFSAAGITDPEPSPTPTPSPSSEAPAGGDDGGGDSPCAQSAGVRAGLLLVLSIAFLLRR